MTWEKPENTVVCSFCKQDFATAFLDHDQAMYCASDARSRVDELLAEGVAPVEITFREVDGGFVGSSEVNVNRIKQQIWPIHDLQKELAEDG